MRYRFLWILILLLVSSPLIFAGDSDPTTKLNDYQKQYYEWTNSNFSQILETEDYASFSQSTKEELGAYWQKQLLGMLDSVNTGGGYKADDAKKWKAINTLAALKYQPAIQELIQVAAENIAKDCRERWMAIRALGLLGDPSVIPHLIPLIYHFNSNSRLWAQIALVQLTDQNFGYDWKAWAEWWNAKGQGNPCSLEPVQWELPPNADPQWGDPNFQKEKDMEHFKAISASGN